MKLNEWTDFDIAMLEVGKSLNLFDPKDDNSFFQEYKHLFWSDCIHSAALTEIIFNLAKVGYLEIDEDHAHVRLNPNFLPLKESK